jgi:hypothetical protein
MSLIVVIVILGFVGLLAILGVWIVRRRGRAIQQKGNAVGIVKGDGDIESVGKAAEEGQMNMESDANQGSEAMQETGECYFNFVCVFD